MKKLYIETYGCQMNFNDSEIVASILNDNEYEICSTATNADLILINTCSIRDHAEQRVVARATELQSLKRKNENLKIGIIGCMAERLKTELFEKLKGVDLLAGPDSYRHLPEMIKNLHTDKTSYHTLLSTEETYEEIEPLRYQTNNISAFVSIMRGCNNFCSYCVVPYTRGRERSRSVESIVKESELLVSAGYKEITYLGQNVNSYKYIDNNGSNIDFPELLSIVASKFTQTRIRYATSHPKDLSEKLIDVMRDHDNICKSIHLPIQSGSDNMLKKMNRKYSVDDYLKKVDLLKSKIPEISISTDVIVGFCDETEDDFRQTLEIMKKVGYYYAFMFKYSERPNTYADKNFDDNIPEEIKTQRLQELINLQQEMSLSINKQDIGKTFEVLVEGVSKRSNEQLFGRNSQSKVVVFNKKDVKVGSTVKVKIIDCTAATLKGELVVPLS